MNRFNFVKDGVTRLPPGFRFQPTDEELVFQYLKCKVFSCPLPASIIPEINVCKYDPWDIPGQPEQDRYFFSYKEAKYRNGNRMNRSTNSGYWKATGADKRISSSRRSNDSIVGIRKTLVFYEGKSPHGTRTDWVMHEYRLHSNGTTNPENEVGEWVLCRLFLKKRSGDSANQDAPIQNGNNRVVESMEVAQPRYFNFMMVHENGAGPVLSSTSSSSSFNGMTEVTSNVSEFEETSGYTY